ncbi:MAG: hypothetical protein LBT09_05265 [Planctomycetaceae bacterium]|jgi:chemotaxis protein histidine kinase CheA|nr:hypothetical protein [Planctomycetaceae bacterium]
MKKKSFSPFAIFRQGQVVWLAALGIMTMFAFIILPAFMQLLPGVRYVEGQGDFASTRHHGKVDPQLLDSLRRNHENLARFYDRLLKVIVQSNPSVLTLPPQEQQAQLGWLFNKASRFERKISDEELINNWMIARYSEDIGITINQNMIIESLKTTTNNLLTKQILNQVLEELNMNEQDLEYLVSGELRQDQMMGIFFISQNIILPSTRWDWLQRLNKSTTLEVATLPVEAFIDKVPEPTNAQIKRFFDENKKRKFDPTLPETGFTSPKQIAFSYIKGVPNQKLLDSISKQDVEQYYNENKEQLFRKPLQPQKDLPGLNTGNFQPDKAIPNLNPNKSGGLGGLGDSLPGLGITNGNTTPTVTPPVTTPEIKQPPETTPENKPKSQDEKNELDKKINSTQNFRYNNLSTQPDVKLVSFQNEPVAEVKEPVANKPAEKTDAKKDTKTETAKPVDAKATDTKTETAKPVDAKVTDTKTETAKPVDTKAADAKATDAKATDAKTETAKPVDTKAADAKATDAKTETAKPVDTKATDAKTETAKPVDTKATDTKTETAKPVDAKTTNTKTETAKPVDAKATDTKTETVKPVDTKATDAKTETAKPVDAKATDTKTETAKPVDAKATDTKTETAKPVDAKATDTKTETAKPVDAKATDAKTETAKPVDTKATNTKTETAKPVDTKATDAKTGGDEVVNLDILYRPLSDVESDIRLHLAQVKIAGILVEIEEKLRVHYDVYRKYIDKKMDNPDASITPPAQPDFSAIIGLYDLEIVSEGLGTIYDIMRRSEFVRGIDEREFIVKWFQGRPYEYQVHRIGQEYERILVWATDFKDEKTPESIDNDEVLRNAVIKRWKEVQARDIAFKAAKELADTAKASKESLKVALAAKSDLFSITETEPFTWLTYGYAITLGSPLRLGEVREKGVSYGKAELDNKYIFAPGEEFMRVTSGLEIGEIGTVFNQPKTTVHIVRLISTSPSEESLWENFKKVPPDAYLPLGQQRILEAREAWLESIRAEMNFKWINKPKEE